jgi:arsenate reductase
MSESRPLRILFLCTGNSARSIMAEAIANQAFGSHLTAVSAGSRAKGTPHPLALQALQRHGLATDGLHSKSWDVFAEQPFDLVITLCDSAAKEQCPVFPGAPVQAHWGFPDPPAANDPPAAFERVFLGLRETIAMFIVSEEDDLARRAATVSKYVAQRFAEA